jgi:threonine dehydratase
MKTCGLCLQDIFMAKQRLKYLVIKTPLFTSAQLSKHTGSNVYLKLEDLQETKSFKICSAANRLLTLSEEEKHRGVIAVSTGNHGRAVAYIARQLGIKAVICLSKRVTQYRVTAMKQLGAKIVQSGKSQDEAYEQGLGFQEKRGLVMVNPFDDPFVIAGQGAIGLEILDDLPLVDTVIVPVSGGGLVAGIALAIKSADPRIQVIGVSMNYGPAMYQSIRAGKLVEVEERDSIADALLGDIGLDNRYSFRMAQEYVDELTLVSEDEIGEEMFFALDKHRLVVEGAAAVGISALLHDKVSGFGENVVVI